MMPCARLPGSLTTHCALALPTANRHRQIISVILVLMLLWILVDFIIYCSPIGWSGSYNNYIVLFHYFSSLTFFLSLFFCTLAFNTTVHVYCVVNSAFPLTLPRSGICHPELKTLPQPLLNLHCSFLQCQHPHLQNKHGLL